MRWTQFLAACAALTLSACQPSGEDDAEFTSGPPPEAEPAEASASDASGQAETAPPPQEELAQQSAPPASQTGDLGDARSSQESVEPDSPTMFQ